MDATGAFEDTGHSDYAQELLEQYKVADLADHSSIATAKPHTLPSPQTVDLTNNSYSFITKNSL